MHCILLYNELCKLTCTCPFSCVESPAPVSQMQLDTPFLSKPAPKRRTLEAVNAALSLTVNSWLRRHGKVHKRAMAGWLRL